MRAGSSRASDKPLQVTGGVLSGPHTGEQGESTPRPESRILTSGPQRPSNTGIVPPHKDRQMMDTRETRLEESDKGKVGARKNKTEGGRRKTGDAPP